MTTAARLSWEDRKQIGQNAEAEFDAMMRAVGFVVSPTSQEINITPELRRALLVTNDQQAMAIRFQPDRFLIRPAFPPAYWEVKAQTSDYPNFSIEQDHWTTNLARSKAGVRIAYAFREFGGIWRADWMANISVNILSRPGGARGSQKPMMLIRCAVVPLMDDFLKSGGLVVDTAGRKL